MRESEFWRKILGRFFLLLTFVTLALALVAIAWVLRMHVEPWPVGFAEPAEFEFPENDVPRIDRMFRWGSPLEPVEDALILRITSDRFEFHRTRLEHGHAKWIHEWVHQNGTGSGSWLAMAWQRASFFEDFWAHRGEIAEIEKVTPVPLELEKGRLPADLRDRRGLTIPALYDAAAREVKWKRRRAALVGATYRPLVIIAADRDVPSDTLVQAIYNLAQAELHQIDLLVKKMGSADEAEYRTLKIARPRLSGGCLPTPTPIDHECARVRSVLTADGAWRLADFGMGDDWCGQRLYPEGFEPPAWHGSPFDVPEKCRRESDSPAGGYFLDGFERARICGIATIEIDMDNPPLFKDLAREFVHVSDAKEVRKVVIDMTGGSEVPRMEFCRLGDYFTRNPPKLPTGFDASKLEVHPSQNGSPDE